VAALSTVVPPRWRIRCAGKWITTGSPNEAQEKQKQKQRAQEQRADLIDKLLSEANKQADQPEVLPAKETIPAK